jgi:uncharacterized DUF497 family protein
LTFEDSHATLSHVEFEFDDAKSRSNKRKHGLDFTEAQALWKNKRVEIEAHPGEGAQMRYAVLGIIRGVHHTIIITYRGTTVRIISARPSSENEKAIYEKAIKKSP